MQPREGSALFFHAASASFSLLAQECVHATSRKRTLLHVCLVEFKQMAKREESETDDSGDEEEEAQWLVSNR